jgi:hypothetical protein
MAVKRSIKAIPNNSLLFLVILIQILNIYRVRFIMLIYPRSIKNTSCENNRNPFIPLGGTIKYRNDENENQRSSNSYGSVDWILLFCTGG